MIVLINFERFKYCNQKGIDIITRYRNNLCFKSLTDKTCRAITPCKQTILTSYGAQERLDIFTFLKNSLKIFGIKIFLKKMQLSLLSWKHWPYFGNLLPKSNVLYNHDYIKKLFHLLVFFIHLYIHLTNFKSFFASSSTPDSWTVGCYFKSFTITLSIK